MKKFLITAAIVICCALNAIPRAAAQSEMGMFIYSGLPVGPLAPGQSFTVGISLQVSGLTGASGVGAAGVNDLSGVSYWLFQDTPAGGPFVFSITNRDVTGSLFTNLQSSLAYPQIMDPINRNPNTTTTGTDLGAIINSGPGLPSGTYFIANVTLSISPTAPAGVYTICNTTSATPGVNGRISSFSDADGDSVLMLKKGFVLDIVPVPEPSTYTLLAFAGLGIVVVAYRRRRGAV